MKKYLVASLLLLFSFATAEQRILRDRPRYSGDSALSREKLMVPFVALSAMSGMGYSS
jgi:hypothetical protein